MKYPSLWQWAPDLAWVLEAERTKANLHWLRTYFAFDTPPYASRALPGLRIRVSSEAIEKGGA